MIDLLERCKGTFFKINSTVLNIIKETIMSINFLYLINIFLGLLLFRTTAPASEDVAAEDPLNVRSIRGAEMHVKSVDTLNIRIHEYEFVLCPSLELHLFITTIKMVVILLESKVVL